MNQPIGVYVVEVVAGRNIRSRIGKERGDIRVFTVKIKYVRGKMPLLQQERIASEIAGPDIRLLCPGFVAIEPLSARPERQARRLVDKRLMRRFVNHKAVDAVEEFLVGC